MDIHPKPQLVAPAPIHPKPQLVAPAPAPPPSPKPTTPRPGGDGSPYPTTFVQADATSFKQVVQMLTGSAETAAAAAASAKSPASAPPSRAPGPKKPAFKLYERRNSLKSLNAISPLLPAFLSSSASAFSPRNQPEILSPSMLDFPALALSPVTPLSPDPFVHRASAEERAIAGRGFYLHPSPRTPRDGEPPRLLPLFPVTSPGAASSSSTASSSSDGN